MPTYRIPEGYAERPDARTADTGDTLCGKAARHKSLRAIHAEKSHGVRPCGDVDEEGKPIQGALHVHGLKVRAKHVNVIFMLWQDRAKTEDICKASKQEPATVTAVVEYFQAQPVKETTTEKRIRWAYGSSATDDQMSANPNGSRCESHRTAWRKVYPGTFPISRHSPVNVAGEAGAGA